MRQGKVNEANKLKAENTKPDSQTLWSANQRFNSLQQVYPIYLRVRQLEPYSPKTRQAVEQLLDLCVKNKAWPNLECRLLMLSKYKNTLLVSAPSAVR